MNLKECIRDVPDFPKPGIVFKDITPLLNDPAAFRFTITALETLIQGIHFDRLVAIESRGFLFAAPLADRLSKGMIPVRKPGKLPWQTVCEEYSLEYGRGKLEIHADAIKPGERVLILDDVLATGGTAQAAANLVKKLGGHVAGFIFVVEIGVLKGREVLKEAPISSLLIY